MRLEATLVVNRSFHDLLGAGELQDLTIALAEIREGEGDGGQTAFFGAQSGRTGLRIDVDELAAFDARVLGHERRMGRSRDSFSLKYVQYLAVLYLEILMDRLTSDVDRLVADLNAFLGGWCETGRLSGRIGNPGHDHLRFGRWAAARPGRAVRGASI